MLKTLKKNKKQKNLKIQYDSFIVCFFFPEIIFDVHVQIQDQ